MNVPRVGQPQLLHERFDDVASRHADRVAVEVPPAPGRAGRLKVTYAELRSHAADVGARLRGLVGPGAIVGVLLPRDSHWLYAAQLAVLHAGGAFTCIDPVFPDTHLQAILADGDVAVLLTDADGMNRLHRLGARVRDAIDVTSDAPPAAAGAGAEPGAPPRPGDLAYVIYTSGTTGRPKGVMIEHGSIANLVESDVEAFQLTPGDRVAQGSSPAYDSSIEETWLAFAAGATLVVMDDQTVRMGPDLVAWLARERVTVFCPPPTLLRTTGCSDPHAALPELRLLYVGGEALTEDLAELWSRGRRLVNGYGPTECTVTVVRGDVTAGRLVTIGRPVSGNRAYVVDAALAEVPDGTAGELCIGGIGLARGYRNLSELTRDKFPEHPAFGRVYRTGDLVRRRPDGELEYLGRIDAQVKLRGYRVELEAIEAHVAACPGVREAACRVQGEGSGAMLAAHVVAADPGSPPSFGVIRDSLRAVLPAYMVPSRFGLIGVIPRSIGGKIDRGALPELAAEGGASTREVVGAGDPLEAAVLEAFGAALKTGTPLSILDDFFLDLGGDSLSAVAVVCSLRQRHETSAVTTRDVYETRTAAALAARLGSATATISVPGRRPHGAEGGDARPRWTTFVQGAWLLPQLVLGSAAAYAVTFLLLPALLGRLGFLGSLLVEIPLSLMGLAVYTLGTVVMTVGLKRVLIGRYRALTAPVWGADYLRHWIVQNAARTIPWSMLAETVASGAVLRALGATVGRRVHIHRGVSLHLGGWDLLTLGDDVTLSRDAHLGLVTLEDGNFRVAPVTIESDATLDIRASVSGHTTVERGALLGALSWLPEGSRVPAGANWEGVPAAASGVAPPRPQPDDPRRLHPALHAALQLAMIGVFRAAAVFPPLAALCVLSWMAGYSASDVAAWLDEPSWSAGWLGTALAASVVWMPAWLAARAIGVRCLPRIAPSVIERWSLASIRLHHTTAEVEAVGTWLSGTLFWPLWLRLAGMRIGRGCEVSTIIDVAPESMVIGDGCFLADGIYLGGPRVHRGTITIAETSLGPGTFLGNHVVIPGGSRLPPALFLGVCTVADQRRQHAGSSWFGNPALELPRRDVVTADRRLTHAPGPARFVSRVVWESLRFALPVPPMVIAGAWLTAVSTGRSELVRAAALAPAATLGGITVLCLGVAALKWVLLGRAKAGQHPLWSCWCSRWDFLYVAWQFYALAPLARLEGTLYLAMYLRLMGVRIGRGVVLGPGFGQVADPDMIIIEDGATVGANYQAHSFEDRVLKMAPVVVGRRATVGESAVLFYGASVGEGAWVSPGSVVMKHEHLLPGHSYAGCPVELASRPGGATAR